MRCKCFVIDPFTRRRRKCLNKTCYTACYVHARKFASKIQRAYRGYRTRRKITMFQKLPSELWDRVLYFTRYQHNVQTKFRKSVLDIHNGKILNLLNIAATGLYEGNIVHLTKSLTYLRIRREKLVNFFDENNLIIT